MTWISTSRAHLVHFNYKCTDFSPANFARILNVITLSI